MQVILIQDVDNLGGRNELVNVKNGYARNYLIPNKLAVEASPGNLKMLEEKINTIREKTEIIVLPEMFSTGFSMRPKELAEDMDGPAVQWMARMAAAHRIILAGSLMIADRGQYFNRLVWMLPNGQYGHYDKRHLFAYAGEHNHFQPGQKRVVARVNGWRILLQVCYDLRFPVWARQQPTGDDTTEYDVLVYVANWPERRAHAWKTLLQARAIENQCYVIGVNRVGEDGTGLYHSGDSMVVDPMGDILFTTAHEEQVCD